MDQKLWVLEILGVVWAVRACVVANQQELTTLRVGRRIYFLQRVSLGHMAAVGR
jgi:hypothetical protein